MEGVILLRRNAMGALTTEITFSFHLADVAGAWKRYVGEVFTVREALSLNDIMHCPGIIDVGCELLKGASHATFTKEVRGTGLNHIRSFIQRAWAFHDWHRHNIIRFLATILGLSNRVKNVLYSLAISQTQKRWV